MTTNSNELVYWYWLRGTSGIGPSRIHSLLETLGSPEAIFSKGYDDYRTVPSVGKKLARSLEASKALLNKFSVQIEKDLHAAEVFNAEILTLSDSRYPSRLKFHKNISPPLLYVRGDTRSLEFGNSIAIIGTREPSNDGKNAVRRISGDLAREDWTIISGLARGIDTAGHQGAVDAEGKTIAVLGCGLDVNYPAENQTLATQIAEHGAVISQYPFGTRPDPDNLKRRNNIIVALADCVFAAEYPAGSGTEIGVNKAIELHKPIFTLSRETGSGDSRTGSDHLIANRFAYPVEPSAGKKEIQGQTQEFYSIKLAILFDLDGVLVDTRKLEREALKATIKGLGGEAPTEEQLSSVSGMSPSRSLQLLSGRPSQELIAIYQNNWNKFSKRYVRPLSKLAAILKQFSDSNHVLGIVTSRNHHQASRLLEAGNITGFFSSITTWGDTTKHKPDPDPINHALAKLGSHDGAVYIGDSPDDFFAASNANITFLGAGWFLEESRVGLLKETGSKVVMLRQTELYTEIDIVRRTLWLKKNAQVQ